MHTPELADGYIIGLDWYSIVGGWEKFEEGYISTGYNNTTTVSFWSDWSSTFILRITTTPSRLSKLHGNWKPF
jgi:hypothetical protein